jgi:hypothetical protein
VTPVKQELSTAKWCIRALAAVASSAGMLAYDSQALAVAAYMQVRIVVEDLDLTWGWGLLELTTRMWSCAA